LHTDGLSAGGNYSQVHVDRLLAQPDIYYA